MAAERLAPPRDARVEFATVRTSYSAARRRALRNSMSVMLPLGALAATAAVLEWPPWIVVTSFVAALVVGVGLGLREGSQAANVYRCPACTNPLRGDLAVHCSDCGASVGVEEPHGVYGRTRLCSGCERRFHFAKGQWSIGTIFYCTHCGAWLLDRAAQAEPTPSR